MDFTNLEPAEISFSYRQRPYVLKEATAGIGVAYRNACFNAAKMSDGKVRGVNNLADAELVLVTGCVFEKRASGELGAVSVGWVKALPDKVFKQLFEKARDISGLQDKKDAVAIRKQIAELQKQLKELDAPKEQPSDTPAPSE